MTRRVKISPKMGDWDYEPPYTMDLKTFLDIQWKEAVRTGWGKRRFGSSEVARDTRKERDLEIQIPVKFPKLMQRMVGQGGKLTVSGNQRVGFSGKSQWTEGEVSTATSRASKFPSLNMEQKSRFTIEGTVGEKVHVQVDRDSERLSEMENSLKIRYDGGEDEIIQEIEAGNTTLSLPSTRFVGFSTQHKGLFGIRTKARIGGLDVVAIASQEKGATAKKTFKGMAEESSNDIRDYEYVRNTYFFLDERYKNQYDPDKNPRDPGNIIRYDPADSVVSIEVYVDDGNVNNDVELLARSGWAFYYRMDDYNPDDPEAVFDSTTTGRYEQGFFHPMDPNDYYVNRSLGYIVLNRSLPDNYVLAVRVEIAGAAEPFGDDGKDKDEITLKLIKPRNPKPDYPTWAYEWKNVYFLGSRGIDPEGFDLKILREHSGEQLEETQGGISYLKIMGLDQHDDTGNPAPDGIIDLEHVDLGRGELIFPSLRPFDSEALDEPLPQLYDSNDDRTRREASRYLVRASLQNRQTRIRLGQINILEGTEVVLIDGVRQTRGTDYNINYMTGEVTFLTDKASNPTADLSIDYEYEPFFSFEQKTLLGLRGEYKFWNEQSSAGATLLFNSEKSPDKRVRVGREPTRGILWDADLNLRFEPELLTKAANALPLIRTDAPSKVTLSAEIARNQPNPNTRGKAYIDDFEGSGNSTSLGILRGIWTRASVPEGMEEEDRGRLVWYNPWNRISVTDIWPNRKVSTQDNLVNILVFGFTPNEASSWAGDSWGGVMRAFRGGGNDFSRSKFIEVWAKGDHGILKIDLGSISEDAWTTGITEDGRPSRGNLNTEDKLVYGQRDGFLQDNEDVGLDGLSDEQEPGYDAQTNPDPSGDNWRYDKTDVYDWINGTERNKNDPDRRDRPDTEDINNNGLLDTKNDYYEYTLNLSEDPFVKGTEHNGWRLFRIPLWGENMVKAGNPDSTRMEFVRLWITGADSVAKIQIAQIEVVGNDWLELGLDDLKAADGGSFDVTVKNTQDNDDYETPPGVHEEIDPITNIPKKEQSLVLQLKDLKPGHRAMAYKTFPNVENYTTYNTMKLFVHGDPALEAVGDSLLFFLQFGADTTNMYEYRGRLHSGWDENSVEIDLAELTRLKFDLLNARADSAISVTDTTRGPLRVRGNPSLSNIKMLVLGVENRGGFEATGEVWFDELRLDDVRTDAGTAVRGDFGVSVADLLGLSVDYTHKTSEFRTLTAKDGGGNTETSYGFRGDVKLGRFLPRAWGVSLPVGFSYGESTKLPRLKPGSDIVLNPEQQEQQRTWGVRKTGNVSFRKTASNPQGWNGVLPFLMGLTLDRVNTNFSFSENESRSPERPFSLSRSYNGSFRYDLSPKKRRSVKLWSWMPAFVPGSLEKSEFFYLPSTLRMQVQGDKKKSEYISRAAKDTTRQESFGLSESYTLSLRPWNSLSTDYDLSIKRDLRTNLDPAKLRFGNEVNRSQTAKLTFEPDLLKWLKQSYSYRTQYRENNDPKLRGAATENLGRNVNSDVTSEAKFTLELSRLLGSWIQKGETARHKGTEAQRRKEKTAAQDTTAREDVSDEKGRISGFLSPRLLLGKMLDAVGPVTASWSHTEKSAIAGLLDRPVWAYQFGISDNPEVDVSSATTTQTDARSTSNRAQWATSLNLSSNLSLKPKYNYEHTFSQSSSRSEDTRSQTFPAIGLRLSGLERWPVLNLLVRSSSLSSNYERKWSRRGAPEGEGEQIEPLSEETAHNFSPLFTWSFQWKGDVGSSLRATWKRSEREDFRGSGGTTEKRDFDLTASIDYRFEPKGRRFNLLFWKNVQLKSHLDLSMDISYKRNYQAHGVGDQEVVPRDDRTTWSIKPNASYRFSNTFTGGAKIEVRRARNNLRERVDNSIEVGVWGEIKLN